MPWSISVANRWSPRTSRLRARPRRTGRPRRIAWGQGLDRGDLADDNGGLLVMAEPAERSRREHVGALEPDDIAHLAFVARWHRRLAARAERQSPRGAPKCTPLCAIAEVTAIVVAAADTDIDGFVEQDTARSDSPIGRYPATVERLSASEEGIPSARATLSASSKASRASSGAPDRQHDPEEDEGIREPKMVLRRPRRRHPASSVLDHAPGRVAPEVGGNRP